MMMMMTRKCYLILILLLISLIAFSQEKDFGIWYGISAEHKLAKKLEIDLSANVRTFNNAAKVDEVFVEAGLGYSLNKHLSVGGAYRLTKSIEDNNSYYFRHKVMLDVKGLLPAGNFNFSMRLRFQTGYKTYIQHDDDIYPYYTGRIKVKAVYKTPTFPVDPYVYIESFCPMFSDKSGKIDKNRYSAGAELRITKKHSVELEYIFQRDYLPHISDINIISINYNIKF
jgi:hypothetical protein